MNNKHGLFLTILALGVGLPALAGPRVSIGDPTTGALVGLSFEFDANENGGGNPSFTNDSSINWTTLDLFVTQPSSTDITCAPGPFFTSCSVSSSSVSETEEASVSYHGAPKAESVFDIKFNKPSELGGIGPDAFFTINLNDLVDGQENPDPSGFGQWVPESPFNAIANLNAATPEPAAYLLFGCGLLLLACCRRLFKRHVA
jgi:hypothetical protein